MLERDGFRVCVTSHAAIRALERVAAVRGADRPASYRWLELTVLKALRDGRKARTCPRWCVKEFRDYRSKVRPKGTTVRFVWNHEETAAMVVVRERDVAGHFWTVLTVVARTV